MKEINLVVTSVRECLHWEAKKGFSYLLSGSSHDFFNTPQCHM